MSAIPRPGRAVLSTPFDAMGTLLSTAESIPDLIALLEMPASASPLRLVRQVSLASAAGQADASQFATICALLAQKCPNLEQLYVADARLSAPAAQSLASLPALGVLALNARDCALRRRQPLPDQVLEQLARSPKLHTLMLGSADLPPTGVTPLQKLVTLRSLTLANCAFYAHSVDSIGTLHRLEAFFHHGEEDCAAVAKAAAQLIHLETLHLAKLRLDGQAIDIGPLQSLSHLRHLHVDEASLTSGALRAVGQGCTVLQELRLDSPIHQRRISWSALSAFKRLRTLHISGDSPGGRWPSGPVLALRKHRLVSLQMPGKHHSTRARRQMLRAFGAGCLTYSSPLRAFQQHPRQQHPRPARLAR